jgi:monoamine oxidase
MIQTDVLIAGAGLAGLSLASALQQKGIDYQLVEARDRIGGRILSTDFQGPDQRSSVADLGPSWVWPGQAHIAALLSELEIDVFEQFSSGLLVYEDETGQVRRDLDYASMGGSLRIDGGIARVTERLAERLDGNRMRLGNRLCAIRKHDGGYRAEIEQSDALTQLQARKVVLAIPPRVMAQQIEFEPGLDDAVMQEMNAIPTWMAAHAKLFARYDRPFWRELGLSGDAISRRGPLMEIHDASPANPGHGALFGFVGLAPDSPQRESSRLITDAVKQLEILYGTDAATPLDVCLMDWSLEPFTATPADQMTAQHPRYGMPPAMAALADTGLLFASSEMGSQFGGFVEGALEASQQALARL